MKGKLIVSFCWLWAAVVMMAASKEILSAAFIVAHCYALLAALEETK